MHYEDMSDEQLADKFRGLLVDVIYEFDLSAVDEMQDIAQYLSNKRDYMGFELEFTKDEAALAEQDDPAGYVRPT